MIIDKAPLRIAIAGTNNDSMYSGGRYHALIMAYSLARAGAEVTFITNKKPKFFDDLEPLAPETLTYVYTGDFRENMPAGQFDFVILIPTGIFLPAFYESVFAFARRANARMALINFESGNWFNAVSPSIRDIRLWEYWRRSVADGGLVISSLRVSDTEARKFYAATAPDSLRFEVCAPAINSVAAEPWLGKKKDNSVLTFVRSTDPHKGGLDLLEIEPAILDGRTLRIVAGGPIAPDFQASLRNHFSKADVTLEFCTAISDSEKFRLIGLAKAVLVPTRFEGFGYPPVEAAYMGAEVVCYDLPVFRETVGKVANFAPIGDTKALGQALATALERRSRQTALHKSVVSLVSVDAMGQRLKDILLRSLEPVPPLPQIPGEVAWGPMPSAKPDPSIQSLPTLPPLLRSYVQSGSGELLFSAQITSPKADVDATLTGANVSLDAPCIKVRDTRAGEYVLDIVGRLSQRPEDGAEARLKLIDEAGKSVVKQTIAFTAPTGVAPVFLDLKGYWQGETDSRLLFAVPDMIDRLLVSSDGKTWIEAVANDGRAMVSLPNPAPHLHGLRIYALAGAVVQEVFSGLPAVPGVGAGQRSKEDAEIEILAIEDEHWKAGLLRRTVPGQGAVIACKQGPVSRLTKDSPGDAVRLASGRLTTIQGVDLKGSVANLTLPIAADPDREGAPARFSVVGFAGGRCPSRAAGAIWSNGLWMGAGNTSGRCVLLPVSAVDCYPADLVLSVIDNTGTEIGIEKLWRLPDAYVAWLEAPVRHTPQGELSLHVVRSSRAWGLALAKSEAVAPGLPDDLAWAEAEAEAGGRILVLEGTAQIAVGDVICLDKTCLRCVTHLTRTDSHVLAILDAAVPAPAPQEIRFASFIEIAEYGKRQLDFSSGVNSPHVETVSRLTDPLRMMGRIPPKGRAKAERPRVLFASIVPPDPADQGNRIVTRNFLVHLLNKGFDVDLLLVGRINPEQIISNFGDRVRVFSWDFPDWEREKSAELRRRIVEDIRKLTPAAAEAGTFEALLDEATLYHPFFIVPDPLIRLAKALYRKTAYHSIVCNYTHMIRVAAELAPIRPLPPVTVITHDALSRLPLEYGGSPLDTMYRRCRPETEAEVLDLVPEALILAISNSEKEYFREIGVRNPVELCEYDGLHECRPYRVNPAAFDRKRIIFHASGNPMNRMAIDWFLERCWGRIQEQVPEAVLVICGAISHHIPKSLPNVEIHGRVTRRRMLELLNSASVAINPTIAGTGLKIKTVEAVCMGLPSVCLPPAIEGLEDVASRFCRPATTSDEFTQACLELLTDHEAWRDLHDSANAFAAERFSEEAIYDAVDAYMRWNDGIEDRFGAPREPYRVENRLEPSVLTEVAPEYRDRASFVLDLIREGQLDLARVVLSRSRILEKEAEQRARLLLFSAELSLAAGDIMAAQAKALEALSEDPGNGAALTAICKTGESSQNPGLASDSWRQLALTHPAGPDCQSLAEHLQQTGILKAAPGWIYPRLKVPDTNILRISEAIPQGTVPGLGWSHCEEWGVWSDAHYARLDLGIVPNPHALTVKLLCHANLVGAEEPLQLRFAVNGYFQPQVEIARNESTAPHLVADIPAPQDDPRDSLSIELYIQNPSPVRAADGTIADGRHLGVALAAVEVYERNEK